MFAKKIFFFYVLGTLENKSRSSSLMTLLTAAMIKCRMYQHNRNFSGNFFLRVDGVRVLSVILSEHLACYTEKKLKSKCAWRWSVLLKLLSPDATILLCTELYKLWGPYIPRRHQFTTKMARGHTKNGPPDEAVMATRKIRCCVFLPF